MPQSLRNLRRCDRSRSFHSDYALRDEDVSKIQDWFEREPSIRDPSATCLRLRPMVRDKMLRYLEVRGPSRHRELTLLAQGAAGPTPG